MNHWCGSRNRTLNRWQWVVTWVALGVLLLSAYTTPAARVNAAPPHASTQLSMSVADLGFTSDPVAQGALSELSVAFPLPEGGISDGQLALSMQPSPVLNPDSTIQVTLNDRPATALTVAQLRKNESVTIPVGSIDDPFLTVRIAGHFFISNDVCTDERGGALWAVLDRHSTLTATPRSQNVTIRDFLSRPGGRVLMHGVWDNPTNQAASIALFSSLNYAYRHGTTDVALAEDAAVPASTDAAAPTNAPVRDVFLTPASDAAPLHMQDNALYVRADQPSLEALLTTVGTSPLLLGQAVQKLEVMPASPTGTTSGIPSLPQSHRLSLTDLDLGNQNVVGSNDESATVRFTLADLGGWPADLNFVLDDAFDAVPTNTLERAFVRVYLNGTLLDTIDIRGQSTLQRTIALPTSLLQTENFLQTTFSYASASGECQGSPYRFTGQMRNSSALSWSRYDNARGTFSEIIGLLRGEGQLMLVDARPEMAQVAARLIGGVSKYSARPLTPRLVDSKSLGTPPSEGYRIVVGGDSSTSQALKLPLDLGQPLQVINPQTSDVVLRGTPGQPMASVQYVPGAVPTVALQTSPNADSKLLASTVAQMISPREFFRLNGNAIVGNGTQIVALDLVDSSFKVRQPNTSTWTEQIGRYSWLIFVVLAALVVGLWVMIYQRVGRRQKPPQAEG